MKKSYKFDKKNPKCNLQSLKVTYLHAIIVGHIIKREMP